jgi:flagellar L-ring protein precursor FlgH
MRYRSNVVHLHAFWRAFRAPFGGPRWAFPALIVVLCTANGSANATSLWQLSSTSLIADRRAAQPGDLITILVSERSVASHQASHDTDKKLDVSGGPGSGLLTFFPELSMSTERSTSGKGATTQSTSLVDRISGRIIAVTPQGALQVESVRFVKLNREELTLTITGLVRRDDIAPDNTILSTQIADLRISSSGRGPIPDKQRPGLISALLSLLW